MWVSCDKKGELVIPRRSKHVHVGGDPRLHHCQNVAQQSGFQGVCALVLHRATQGIRLLVCRTYTLHLNLNVVFQAPNPQVFHQRVEVWYVPTPFSKIGEGHTVVHAKMYQLSRKSEGFYSMHCSLQLFYIDMEGSLFPPKILDITPTLEVEPPPKRGWRNPNEGYELPKLPQNCGLPKRPKGL